MEDAVVIIEVMRDIHAYDNFFEEIFRQQQRGKFRGFLFVGVHAECRLNINLLICVVDNEINLFLSVAAACPIRNNTHIDRIPSAEEFVVYHIFHDMPGVILSIVQPCVTKSGVLKIQLIRRADIFLTFYIIPLCLAEQEGVF